MIRRAVYTLFAAVACGALIALLAIGVAALGGGRTLDEALAHGRHPKAPGQSMRLARLSEAGVGSLSEYRGRVVLLNFWASWCPPCAEEAPAVASAQQALAPYGATVVGISERDARGDSMAFMRAHHLRFPDLRDNGPLAEAFGTSALPESFLIDGRGRIAALTRGRIDAGFLLRASELARGEAAGARRQQFGAAGARHGAAPAAKGPAR